MIRHYELKLDCEQPMNAALAYPLYALLMQEVKPAYADFLHEQKINPIAQNLLLTDDRKEAIWSVNLFGQESIEQFEKILATLTRIDLKVFPHQIKIHSEKIILDQNVKELITEPSLRESGKEIRLDFYTPTAFKSDGVYQFFPSIEHLLKNLMMHWNASFDTYFLDDEDLFRMMRRGVRMTSYRLRSSYFTIKKNKIPGFVGELTLQARLSAPLMRVWQMLMVFAAYRGIGIKTSLGMGGVRLCERNIEKEK